MKTSRTFDALEMAARHLGSALGSATRSLRRRGKDDTYYGMKFQAWLNLRSFFNAAKWAKLSAKQIRELALAARKCNLKEASCE